MTGRIRKGQTIHQHIIEKTELAKIYALDGAFYTAAVELAKLSKDVEAHARACDFPVKKKEKS